MLGRYANADLVLATMGPWLDYGHKWSQRKKRKSDSDPRTLEEQAWDSAVIAVAEYVRRLTRDESLSLTIHDLLSPKTKDGK